MQEEQEEGQAEDQNEVTSESSDMDASSVASEGPIADQELARLRDSLPAAPSQPSGNAASKGIFSV